MHNKFTLLVNYQSNKSLLIHLTQFSWAFFSLADIWALKSLSADVISRFKSSTWDLKYKIHYEIDSAFNLITCCVSIFSITALAESPTYFRVNSWAHWDVKIKSLPIISSVRIIEEYMMNRKNKVLWINLGWWPCKNKVTQIMCVYSTLNMYYYIYMFTM